MIGIILAAALAFLPDAKATPGVVNPGVTQANVQTTICVHGWTATLRPPVRYTNMLKAQQLAAMGLTVDPRSVEEDHLISLEIGGSPTDPGNIWPEPWAGPWGARRKDVFETFLKRQICSGKMPLGQAQDEIRHDWIAAYLTHPELPPAPAPHP